ncbi:hypothetical protein COV93_08580 [Candidatus Woesearchaeota archaeon CG11_big_fil_rev_8_21_14_0_20_43_8]|nr:MAG: hypothetical protein COV93_08580 [Candidatus Woesearchaeota archaeon CG11_big_fil_rev_8_21_14_0_20_43_8]PIO04825.1 MAG: hypothetical protein COT47_07385 [Candidatus Woesearchaeota archaeon CG08_land_8_20_14_0_20_43_7]
MSKEKECGCHCCDDEPMSTEDIANHADDKVDALIQLLLKKKVITEDEYDKEFKSLFEDEE